MKIRKATEKDSEILFQWRNDQETRENSIETREIPWEGHVKWLEKSLVNSMRNLYIVEDDNAVLYGTIRLDKENDKMYEISWTVAPSLRGQGIGKAMMKKFFAEYLQDKKGHVIARAKKANSASIKIIESLGFTYQNEQGGLTCWVW